MRKKTFAGALATQQVQIRAVAKSFQMYDLVQWLDEALEAEAKDFDMTLQEYLDRVEKELKA